jgi:hypothetical protein
MADLSAELLGKSLDKRVPILTGPSATFLLQAPREMGTRDDDIRGDPQGHFVVLTGYEPQGDQVPVADPRGGTLWVTSTFYPVPMDRLLTAIPPGVLTYDAALLILQPERRT